MKSFETEADLAAEIHKAETRRIPQMGSPGDLETLDTMQTESVGESRVPDVEDLETREMDLVGTKEETASQWRFSLPSRAQMLRLSPFWAVILLGAILRFWGLGDRPLHHDESLHGYFSLLLLHNDLQNWLGCLTVGGGGCYHYDPLLHGPFQFHAIALVYQLCQWLGVYDNGVNTFTVRIPAAALGTVIVGLPYFLRDRLGTLGAWLACFLLAISPSMVYFSRFAREDIYMACFTLLLVVATARYLSTRRMRWIIWGAVAFALSYATKEATFLTIAIFGSFASVVICWELGLRLPVRSLVTSPYGRFLPTTAAPLAVIVYFLVLGVVGKWFFNWLKNLSIYITATTANTKVADLYVQNLKEKTLFVLPCIGIILGLYVLSILIREMLGYYPLPEERIGLARWVDARRQPWLERIVTLRWTHWFTALLIGWSVFLLLYTALFTDLPNGIANGIWQGLYYWIQQQQVARGEQPWYYYLLLIPLYEQIGLVFAVVGIVRALLRPTRFRLFLVYWFVGNFFIYSWAGEKMPWLMIHMTMPMMLLAALGLEPAITGVIHTVSSLVQSHLVAPVGNEMFVGSAGLSRKKYLPASIVSVATLFLAVLLLVPTLQNMYQVNYVHAADAPHEMMIYVQTTTDITIVMQKIESLDKELYNGQHKLPIGVTTYADWPYEWYLRDYTNVCFNFPTNCAATASNIPIIITGQEDMLALQAQYTLGKQGNYLFHRYHLRSWWDEGYKPPPCISDSQNTCAGLPTWGGVGPFLWLSYGDYPPPHASFDLGRAAHAIWQWWWTRKPFGGLDGAYDMGVLIRKDLGVAP